MKIQCEYDFIKTKSDWDSYDHLDNVPYSSYSGRPVIFTAQGVDTQDNIIYPMKILGPNDPVKEPDPGEAITRMPVIGSSTIKVPEEDSGSLLSNPEGTYSEGLVDTKGNLIQESDDDPCTWAEPFTCHSCAGSTRSRILNPDPPKSDTWEDNEYIPCVACAGTGKEGIPLYEFISEEESILLYKSQAELVLK